MSQVDLDEAIARAQANAIDDAAERAAAENKRIADAVRAGGPFVAPTLGLIVHAVLENGSLAPGIVTAVHEDSSVDLELFGVRLVERFAEGWPYSASKAPKTWHWPPRT